MKMREQRIAILIKDVIVAKLKKEIYSCNENGINTSVQIESISPQMLNDIKTPLGTPFHKNQMILTINIKTNQTIDELAWQDYGIETVSNVLFAFFLSLDDIRTVYDRYGDRCKISSAIGSGLPLAIFKMPGKHGINLYYANDASSAIYSDNYYINFKKNQRSLFERILTKVKKFNNPYVRSSIITIHTVNWAKEDFFLIAVTVLFSCFEWLTNKGRYESFLAAVKRQTISLTSVEEDTLDSFGFLRNAIAHPSVYLIIRTGRVYTITKKKDGTKKTFNIDEIMSVRAILLRLMRKSIGVS